MKVITKYLRIYSHFWKLAFSLGTVYRVDSFLLFVAVGLYLIQNFVFFGSVFRSLPQVGGWTLPEYMLLLSIFSLNWGIFKMFYGRTMESAIDMIFTGQYDYLLLKPINARFLSYFCPPLIKSFPSVMFNLALVVFVIITQHLAVTPVSIGISFVYLFLGQLIIFSFSEMATTTAFFTNNASDVYAIFENAWDQAAYPGEAFTKSIHFILTFVIPIALFASFPAKVLLGKVSNPFEYFYPIIVAAICLTISNIFYKFGIKNYTSAGG
jgi:ABC-2 type transport system permease protein